MRRLLILADPVRVDIEGPLATEPISGIDEGLLIPVAGLDPPIRVFDLDAPTVKAEVEAILCRDFTELKELVSLGSA